MQPLQRFPGDLVEHARAFVALATEVDVPGAGAFERAARKLHLDASVLRRRLAALDEYAGGELLVGRGRELRLTPLGVRVRTLAGELLERAEAMHTRAETPERVVIGCTEAISSDVLPHVLGPLVRQAPALTVVVRRLGTEACLAGLHAGEVDVGIVRGGTQGDRWPRELAAAFLGRDRLWVAGRVRSLKARDIAREPLILYGPASATRRRVMKELQRFAPRIAVEVDTQTAAIEYARRGLGLAFVSSLATVTPHAKGVRFRDVTRLFGPSAFWLLTSLSPSPTTVRVAEAIRRVC